MKTLPLFSSIVGAAHSPSIDVFGSYFPAWWLCLIAGIFLTIIARLLFVAWNVAPYVRPAPVVYSCLTAVFAMTVWLIFFRS